MTPLDKYGNKALKPEEQEEAEKQRAAKSEGTDESVYGPKALAGEGDRETVENAAERAGVDVPEEMLEEGQSEPESTSEGSGETLADALGEEYDEDAPPDGYDVEHEGGGYYSVTTPDGEGVENPDVESGNWPGKELAFAAAWDHASRTEEEEAEGEPEEGGDEEAPEADLEEPGPDEQVSVEKLERLLANDPNLIDNRMHAEFARAEGPRREALEVILEVEEENQDREAVVNTLANAIEDLEPGEDEGDEE